MCLVSLVEQLQHLGVQEGPQHTVGGGSQEQGTTIWRQHGGLGGVRLLAQQALRLQLAVRKL